MVGQVVAAGARVASGSGRLKRVLQAAGIGTGAKIAGDIIGDTIEGAGSALGGALQGAGAAAGGALQGLGSAIGGALQGALTEGDKTIINMGIVGKAGKQNIKRPVIVPPPSTSGAEQTLPAADENMPTKKLLSIAVKYLASIDRSLKNQLKFDTQLARNEAAAVREQMIEGGVGESFNGIADSLKISTKEKQGSSPAGPVVSSLITAFKAALVGGTFFGIMGMNDDQFRRLEENVRKVKEALTSDVMDTILTVAGIVGLVGGTKYLTRAAGRGIRSVWNRVRGRPAAPIPASPAVGPAAMPGAPAGGGMLVNGQYGSLRNGQNIGVGGTPFPTTQTGTRAMSSLTTAEIRSLGQQGIVPRGIGYYDTRSNRMLRAPEVFERVANAGRRMSEVTEAQARLLRKAGYEGTAGGVFWSKDGRPVTKEVLFREIATLERVSARGLLPRFLSFLKSTRGKGLWLSMGIDAALMAFGVDDFNARNVAGMVGGGFGTAGGAMAGAALGTMILPGVGTVIGGLLGGAIGYFGGRSLAQSAVDYISPPTPPRPDANRETGSPATPQGQYVNYTTSGNFRKDAKVVEVLDAGAGFTTVRYEDGTVERRGGTRASRNNNPGNIQYGDFARSQGAVGSDGRFAVFPTPRDGFAAMKALLSSGSYENLTIAQAIAKWAPPSENDTQAYINGIASMGIDVNQRFSDLSDYQKAQVVTGMAKKEGYYAEGSGPNINTGGGGGIMDAAAGLTMEGVQAVVSGLKDFIATDTTFRSSPGMGFGRLPPSLPTVTSPTSSERLTAADAERAARINREQIQNEANEIAGLREASDRAEGQNATAASAVSTTEMAVRNANGGALDVMNPNYKVSESSILTTYLMFFGIGVKSQ